MIKRVRDNYYRVQVRKTTYYLSIREDRYFQNCFKIYCENRASTWTFYDALNISYKLGALANNYLGRAVFQEWNLPTFNTKEKALGFLFFLDRNYNSTPQPKMQFTNLKLVIPE